MVDHAETLRAVFAHIRTGDLPRAAATLQQDYPYKTLRNAGRRITPYQSTEVFLRDGFVDRYTGQRLVNPAALRLVAALLPEEFPAHKNWKLSETHVAFYELFPTIDHLVPVARGGPDEENNWITTSMGRNSAKANYLLEEIGWELCPPGDLAVWDGLTAWVVAYLDGDPELSVIAESEMHHCTYIRRWANASRRALKEAQRVAALEKR